MKIIDLLNKIANGTLEDGFEFYFNEFHFIYFKSLNEIQRLENGINIGSIYCLDKHLNDEVKVIEKNKEIEEMKEISENLVVPNSTADDVRKITIKINEIVRAVNKLNKEREEK